MIRISTLFLAFFFFALGQFIVQEFIADPPDFIFAKVSVFLQFLLIIVAILLDKLFGVTEKK
jgi:hypothetical protein